MSAAVTLVFCVKRSLSRPRKSISLALVLFLFLVGCNKEKAPAPASAVPQRIVSVTITGDVLLEALRIDPARIQAVSALADDSGIHEAAGCFPGKPRVGANLEKILALSPDLVVVGSFHDPAFLKALKEAAVPLLELDDPSSIDKVRIFLKNASSRLGEARGGDSLAAWMDSTLGAVRTRVAACKTDTPTVLYWSDGYTAGDKNTVDELLTVAGAHNLAAQLGKHKATRISTEELATTDPDWLMLSSWKHAGSVPFPEQARTLRAYREGRILRIPSKLLLSTTHRLALAADTLQKALHRGCAK
jgi:iron complex transport system substrate-binding protein